jgi:phosphate transport system permease protein
MAVTAENRELEAPTGEAARYRVRKYSADLSAIGEPWLWGLGGALALGIVLVAGFLALIFWNGTSTFWPKPIERLVLTDGAVVAGEPTRSGAFRVGDKLREQLSPEALEAVDANDGYAHRVLYRSANFDLYGTTSAGCRTTRWPRCPGRQTTTCWSGRSGDRSSAGWSG